MDRKLNYILGTLLAVAVVALGFNLLAPAKLGISQKASKFTDVEVTRELQTADLTVTDDLTVTGDTRLSSVVQKGSIATFVTTSAATAANVCDNPLWTITPAAAIATVTLPATTTLLADCLSTNGDTVNLTILNGSGTTSTVLAAGAGGTLLYSSTTTIAAGKGALLTVVRDATATYKAYLVNTAN